MIGFRRGSAHHFTEFSPAYSGYHPCIGMTSLEEVPGDENLLYTSWIIDIKKLPLNLSLS
jgi:hypothetical protein